MGVRDYLEQMLSTPGWIPPVARGGEGRRLEQPERRSAAGAGRKRRSRGSPSVGAGGSEAEAERKGRWSPPAARGSVRCGAVRCDGCGELGFGLELATKFKRNGKFWMDRHGRGSNLKRH